MDQTLEMQMRGLLDKQAITEVLYRYCRAVDRNDVDMLRTVYHPDAEDIRGVHNGPVEGLFRMLASPDSPIVATFHIVSNVQIELAGDRAHVESYLSAQLRAKVAEGLRDDFLRCRNVDRFERRDGEWRIARRVVVYESGENRPAQTGGRWESAPEAFVMGARSREDRVYTERAANLTARPA